MAEQSDDGYPFSGLRVLDLSSEIAGPYATRLLADLGAQIIKVESPAGDPLRRFKTSAVMGDASALAPGEDGALFQWLNASKRSIALDLDEESDQAVLRRLYAETDVVVESFDPGHLDARGLGFEALRRARAAASLVSLSSFGQDGPWRDRPATEFTLQAETGAFSGRGYADLGPVVAGGRLGEYVAGTFVSVAIAALGPNARAGAPGRHVDVSMLEAMLLSFQPYQYIHGQMRPGEPMPTMVEVPSIEPAQDGMIGFSTQTSQQWQDLLKLVGHPELVEDESLCLGYERFMRREEILPLIQAWTRERTIDEIVDLAGLMRIPVAPIGTGESVLRTDHLIERRFYRDHPAGFKVPGPPFQFEHAKLAPLTDSPRLDADREAVLGSIAHVRDVSTEDPGQRDADNRAVFAPLAGLRVVDFSAFWAGPFATTILAGLGAEVVKVESIQRPDGMRFASGFVPEDGIVWEWAPVFHGANSGKQAVTLDLDSEDGIELARKLVREADIVVENFSPRVMERFGFDREGVRALNPETILVRMPAFGLSGPWRDRVGFAMTIEQASGLAWVTGFPEREPIVPRGVCDPLGGTTAVLAILAALEERRRGAGGQEIEVALLEVGLTAAAEQVIEQSAYGQSLGRTGNRGPVSSPQAVLPCRDERAPDGRGWVAVAVANDDQWSRLVSALGEPGWATDDVLRSEEGRRRAADRIEAGLAEWCAERDARQIADEWTAAGVPAAALHDQRGVVPGHPQLDARGFLRFLDHPFAGRIGYPNLAWRVDGRYPERTLPPTLGEHNGEVLGGGLGLAEDDLADLEKRQVIGKRPSFL